MSDTANVSDVVHSQLVRTFTLGACGHSFTTRGDEPSPLKFHAWAVECPTCGAFTGFSKVGRHETIETVPA